MVVRSRSSKRASETTIIIGRTLNRPTGANRATDGHALGAPATPLWRVIAGYIEDAIVTGTFGPHTVMPSETDLGRLFNTSRATAGHALDYLAKRGRVTRVQGKGTFVAAVQALPDVAIATEHTIDFAEVAAAWTEERPRQTKSRRRPAEPSTRQFIGTVDDRVVARLAVATGRLWQPAAADLTATSLLGPPPCAGRSRLLAVRAEERAEFGGTAIRVSVQVRDEFAGDRSKTVSLLHPDFFAVTWNVNSRA